MIYGYDVATFLKMILGHQISRYHPFAADTQDKTII